MNKQEPLPPKSAEAFNFKLDLLKWELDSINGIIDRMDHMAKSTKYWAILIWAGTISLSFGKDAEGLRPTIVYLTAIIPLVFWILDTTFRRLQRRSIYRMMKISEFVNSENFQVVFEKKDFGGFQVLDPAGRDHRSDKEYKKFISFWRTFTFGEIIRFYLGLMAISILLGLFVTLFVTSAS